MEATEEELESFGDEDTITDPVDSDIGFAA